MPRGTGQTRLRFDGVEFQPDGNRCKVQANFSFGGEVISASAEDSTDGAGPIRAAAVAALDAVVSTVSGKFLCSLADIDRVNALGKDLIAVLVNVEFEGRQLQVFGSCQVSGDELGAAVRASLNATNRFVELTLRH